jgi:alcohol dehydrogenase
MRGYVLSRYGKAMELREVPKPVAGPGEVLIRVHAAGLNTIDYRSRDGAMRMITRLDLPIVAGSELSGVAEAVGTGVTRVAVGDRVCTRVDKMKLGAFAEYATVDENLVARMPDRLDFAQAAGVPLAGLAALQALRDELAVKQGDRVFISGGAGGVGTFAIQLAKWMGAEVTTTASPRGEELVKSLGADRVIDYTKQKVADVPGGYDGVLDLVGGEDLAGNFGIVKRGATVVTLVGMPEPTTARKDLGAGRALTVLFWLISAKSRRQARRHGVRYRFLFMHASGTDLELLAKLVEDGLLKVVLDRTFEFDQIADAFAYLETGRAKGKVVVKVP